MTKEIWVKNYFWAKMTSDNRPGILAPEHILNVGFGAQKIV